MKPIAYCCVFARAERLKPTFITFASIVWLISVPISHAAVMMTIEGPGVATSQVPGAPNEGFESFPLASVGRRSAAWGRYSSSSADVMVVAADQYGGAGGAGRYLVAYSDSVLTLDVAQPQGYAGLWWSSMESWTYNIVEVTTSAGDVFDFPSWWILNSGLLRPGHYGNPFPPYQGENASEVYTYVNFFATDESSKLTRLRLYGGHFEIDNLSLLPTLSTVRGTGIVSQGIIEPYVPEPSAVVLALVGVLVTGTTRRWRQAIR